MEQLKINLKLRLQNKTFVVSFIAQAIILIQAVAYLCGVSLDLSDFSSKIVLVIDAIFAMTSLLGITVDPTTDGISDSERALAREVITED